MDKKSALDIIYNLAAQKNLSEIKKIKKALWDQIKSESFEIWTTEFNNTEKMFTYKQIIGTYFSDFLLLDLQKIGFVATINLVHQENSKKTDKVAKQKILSNNQEKVLFCDEKGNQVEFPIIIAEDLFDSFCHIKDNGIKYTYLLSVYKDKSLDQLFNLYYLNSFYKKLGAA